MKKLALAAILATLLAACGKNPMNIKLSEMNEPQNAKVLLETLSPTERSAVQSYVVTHTMRNDLDYKMTIKETIEAQKKEATQGPNAMK